MRIAATGLLVLATALPSTGAAGADALRLFDGKSASGWINNRTKRPIPAANVQDDGLNPHNSGGYIVAHETPFGDFVLDFDYKLSPGCNSGVFLRVGDLADPVNTGIEVAIDDTKGTGMHDTGAFYDLAPPRANPQKPAGEWNHMTVTAQGPKLSVRVNGQEVSSIDLDAFDKPGKRPDGSSHKFSKVVVKDLPRSGHLGFQDHGQNCWFKDITLKPID